MEHFQGENLSETSSVPSITTSTTYFRRRIQTRTQTQQQENAVDCAVNTAEAMNAVNPAEGIRPNLKRKRATTSRYTRNSSRSPIHHFYNNGIYEINARKATGEYSWAGVQG